MLQSMRAEHPTMDSESEDDERLNINGRFYRDDRAYDALPHCNQCGGTAAPYTWQEWRSTTRDIDYGCSRHVSGVPVWFGCVHYYLCTECVQPKRIANGAAEHVAAARFQWTQLPGYPGVVTKEYAALVPQTDRMSNQAVWEYLTGAEFHVDPAIPVVALTGRFPWWLWLATLNHQNPHFIGVGIQSALLLPSRKPMDRDTIVISFTRADGTECIARLRRNTRGLIKVTLEQ